MRRFWRYSLSAALTIAAGCGGAGGAGGYSNGPTGPSTPTNPAPTTANTVVVGQDAFTPAALNVAVGTTVTWSWSSCGDTGGYGYGGSGSGCVTHNVSFDDGSHVTSGDLSSGSFSRTFSAAGTYQYHCSIHGSAMSGSVVVK